MILFTEERWDSLGSDWYLAHTPMSTTLKLSKDASGKSVDKTLYRGMIESLLYLTASRPDISFSVGVCEIGRASCRERVLVAV